MNIIIPIGEDDSNIFKNDYYKNPKPLINIFGTFMIFYLIDNINFIKDDNLIIIYQKDLDKYNFKSLIENRYLNKFKNIGVNLILIDLDNQTMYKLKQDGCWYYMNTRYIHTACNFGPVPRIQLVVRRLLKHGTIKNPIDVVINPLEITSNTKFHSDTSYRYKFDKIFSPWLNHADKENILGNFAFENVTATFTTEIEQLEYLNSINQGFSISTNVNTS